MGVVVVEEEAGTKVEAAEVAVVVLEVGEQGVVEDVVDRGARPETVEGETVAAPTRAERRGESVADTDEESRGVGARPEETRRRSAEAREKDVDESIGAAAEEAAEVSCDASSEDDVCVGEIDCGPRARLNRSEECGRRGERTSDTGFAAVDEFAVA